MFLTYSNYSKAVDIFMKIFPVVLLPKAKFRFLFGQPVNYSDVIGKNK